MMTFWRGRKVFVTGATGMVGSWLVKELLARNAHVVALIRDADPGSELYRSGDASRVQIVNGQLEDYQACERAINEHEVDTVFHLGAQTIVGAALRSPWPTFESNIRGTYNLLDACRVHEKSVQRVVVASSDKAYGESDRPYHEDMPLQGRHPYDVSKSCADLIAQAYHHTYGLPVAIARCGNIYGGGDLNWSRIVPGTIRSLLRDERPIVRSDGTFVRDYLYVKDAALAYLRLAERLGDKKVRGQAFNFSTERPLTVLALITMLQKMLGKTHIKPDVQNVARAEIRDQRLRSTRAREVLKWRPAYDYKRGLRETIDWYKDFLVS
jgi:CDP-glucose 4,6-dehydratase